MPVTISTLSVRRAKQLKRREKIRKNFQMAILDIQLEQEAMLSPDEVVFLNRAIPDALAYYYFLNLPTNDKLLNAMNIHKYKKVFILDRLPIVQVMPG